jgi:hypothetical protein
MCTLCLSKSLFDSADPQSQVPQIFCKRRTHCRDSPTGEIQQLIGGHCIASPSRITAALMAGAQTGREQNHRVTTHGAGNCPSLPQQTHPPRIAAPVSSSRARRAGRLLKNDWRKTDESERES